MLLLTEIFLTIKAWNRGWGGWALAPWVCVVWICFVFGVVTARPTMGMTELAFSSLLLAPKIAFVAGWTPPMTGIVFQSLLLMDLPLLMTLAAMAWRTRPRKVAIASA